MKLKVKVAIVLDVQDSAILNGILDDAQQAGITGNPKRTMLVQRLREMDKAADHILSVAEEVQS
jgi:hypothetical protein